MYNVERQYKIMDLLQLNGSVNVSELSKTFQTSKETIRRDLCELEESGILTRTHGGAIVSQKISLKNESTIETPISIRNIQNVEEKKAICKIAASTISEGDTVFIDNSSTCINLYQYIPTDIHITFLTNSISFLVECSKASNAKHTIICLGGIFKHTNLSIYGNIAIKNAQQYYPSKAFISCAGISGKFQITDSGIHEIDIKRTLIDSSQSVYLLADYTKFHQTGQVYLSECSAIDYLITDKKTDIASLHFLNHSKTQIIVAD